MRSEKTEKKSFIFNHRHIFSAMSGCLFGLLFYIVDKNKDPQIVAAFSIFFGFIVDIFLSTVAVPESQETLERIKRKLEESERFIKNLIVDRRKVDQIEGHLFASNDLTKEVGFKVWSEYLDGFQITERGIHLEGEELSIATAIKIWRMLSVKQSQNKDKPIVVRITHSNDISIWLPSERSVSNDLYTFQKTFVQYGGIIVRFLIGHTTEPDERYRLAMQHMKSNGIDVRYFSSFEVGEKDFDFLYLRNESFVLKWYSGAKGGKIAGCFISDKAEEEIINRWATLFYKAEIKGRPITSIPKELQFEE